MDNIKERISYIKSIKDGYFAAYPVNIKGVCVQGKSIDELNLKLKTMCKFWLSHLNEILDQDEPFEFKEESDLGVWLYGEQDNKIREELKHYKDIFGELPITNK